MHNKSLKKTHSTDQKKAHVQSPYPQLWAIFCVVFVAYFSLMFAGFTYAQTLISDPNNIAKINELQSKIDERNNMIKELEKEIATYQNQVNVTSQKAKTLQNAIATINASINKLNAENKKTQANIAQTEDTLEQIAVDIGSKEQRINEHKKALSSLIAFAARSGDQSMVEVLLSDRSLAGALEAIDDSRRVQGSIQDTLDEMYAIKKDLELSKGQKENQKKSLLSYHEQLRDKQQLEEDARNEQKSILTETKNKESEYTRLLKEKKALKDAFEKELRSFEAELKIAIDPQSIPKAGTAVLAWPADNVVVTQLFGDTEFSRQNTLVYNGNGHNGIDLGMPVGTTLKSAAAGRVVGTGDTDTVCRGASYGKWILIEHQNGLSTLYAHMSLVKVVAGQTVAQGETIGYSGNTGYSTGPHLHFTVYATQGVKVQSKQSVACGGVYTMPIADLKAYLNPILYLPPR